MSTKVSAFRPGMFDCFWAGRGTSTATGCLVALENHAGWSPPSAVDAGVFPWRAVVAEEVRIAQNQQ